MFCRLPSPTPLVAPAAYTIGEISKLGTEHEGVAHRMVRDLYASAFRANPRSFRVHVQFVQVYVEKVFDLLADAGDGHSKLTLREDKSRGVYVDGARQIPAASADECLAVLQKASQHLKFAATKMNRHSSRSHALCQLRVEISTGGCGEGGGGGGGGAGGGAGIAPSNNDVLGLAVDHSKHVKWASGNKDHLATPSGSMADLLDGGPRSLQQWRRKSVQLIKHNLEASAVQAKTTRATMTLCDLAGSEDVGRSGAVDVGKTGAHKMGLAAQVKVIGLRVDAALRICTPAKQTNLQGLGNVV